MIAVIVLDKEEAKLLLSPYKNPIDHDLIFFRNGMMSSHLLLKDMPINVNLLTIAPIVEELVSTFLVGNLTHFVLRKNNNCLSFNLIHFTERFKVGQNLHIYKQSIRSAATNWTRGIDDWYNEVDLFDRKWVKPFK